MKRRTGVGSPGSVITMKSMVIPVEKPGDNRWRNGCEGVKCRQGIYPVVKSHPVLASNLWKSLLEGGSSAISLFILSASCCKPPAAQSLCAAKPHQHLLHLQKLFCNDECKLPIKRGQYLLGTMQEALSSVPTLQKKYCFYLHWQHGRNLYSGFHSPFTWDIGKRTDLSRRGINTLFCRRGTAFSVWLLSVCSVILLSGAS